MCSSDLEVIVDEIDGQTAIARSHADAPEIDGLVFVQNASALPVGALASVVIDSADDHDLFGHLAS